MIIQYTNLQENINGYANVELLCEGLSEKIPLEELRKIACKAFLKTMKAVNKLNEPRTNKIAKAILTAVTTAALIASIVDSKMNKAETETFKENMLQEYSEFGDNDKYTIYHDKYFDEKVKAVKAEIERCVALKQGEPNYILRKSPLDPKVIVSLCNKYHYDLPLILAQLRQESSFGISERAVRTNSPLSFGCYDDGRDIAHFNSQNESIEPYIKLILNDYLINGKTVDDLLKVGGFVNKNGDRYASDKNYETLVKEIRDGLIRKYPVLVK